jgi:formiminotetrahydrofolate cyclodeaminase
MAPGTRWVDLSLAEFAERLSERTPTPGGGSLSAYLAACGAAAASMAFRLTSGERFAEVESEMAARAAELDAVRARALELVQLDSDAYDSVGAAFRLPKGSEEQKAERSAAIQAAMLGALEVPLETMRIALAGLRLVAEGAPESNPNVASDCASGAQALAAGLEGAAANVRINAKSLRDRSLAAARLAECARLREQARQLLQEVEAAVEQHLA